MLIVDNLSSRYGRIEVLHGLSLEVKQGEIVTLVGSNGAGKTTLLRAISGVQPMSGGSVKFLGQPIDRLAPHVRVAQGIVQVPEGRQVFSPLSVEDNLKLGAWSRKDGEVATDIEGVYATFPVLAEKRHLPAGALSGGQQQMLAMGRALMARPKLMLLDEPSMGLAPILVDQIFAIIGGLKRQGITVLLVEQNAYAALAIADRGYVIETGRISHTGTGRELLNDARVRTAYLGL
ncbi:ABC transporter ATP-binding protein [Pseudorhodoplanes sinuspersici]|uniref:ABC transporter ATP-binding protein n=1 Tax=Pseudorhodoplanes sinuspersici TaxID=1235591 RepID=A0A1W6ZU59_9HYPH|nr:ABC transporter ATP-binding protein [Pseudorhodoplanes sinuspersici]ARQ00661.1 ABC transporter ATP-binding protein [Pseudorhodoplanes sinuspersici]RKE72265.1 amino acid/amide ABC transporter ATP-binding protein 2 (HAAT family) [Pseudorhodoplanes sinuspersici]